MVIASCNDFLTIYPTNSTVLENYWKEKADVEGMVATCYKTMLSSDFISRCIVWGEIRSDDVLNRTSSGTEIKYIVEANLLPQNSYCNWAIFYKVINYCNIVLKYAPNVVKEDPDFSQGDLDAVEGQMYALRALCHFYLVRTFRDIPLARTAMVDDSQDRSYPQVEPLVALDSIMYDLKLAEYKVLRSGVYASTQYNKGYITRDAVRSIMADVLLWQAAFHQYKEGSDSVKAPACDDLYTQCIVCCDSVINAMNQIQRAKALKNQSSSESGTIDETTNPYYLIQNSKTSAAATKNSEAYDEIFGDKNSSESIFELQFDQDNNPNSSITSFYGYSATTGSMVVPSFIGLLTSTDALFKKSDLRQSSFLNASASSSTDDTQQYTVAKYTTRRSPAAGNNYRSSSKCDANWIVYRKTDVMLMKAEALALRNSDESDLKTAFSLVKAVNDRSLTTYNDSLTYDAFKTQSSMEKLVYDERQRELMFEGKRWFDLVRKALREHSTTNILTWIVKKLDSNAGAVQSKMSSINTLFFPISEDEMNVNPLLKQNEAYKTETTIEKN